MADRFWVGGTGNWDASTTTHWGSASGTEDNASVPTSGDNVIFDTSSSAGNAAYTVTITATANCANFTMDGPDPADATKVTWAGSSALNIFGNMNLSGGTAGITRTYTGSITFKATSGTKTIDTNSVILSRISFDGSGGTFQLTNHLLLESNFVYISGTFDATTNSKNVTIYNTQGTNITIQANSTLTFYGLYITPPTYRTPVSLTGNIVVTNNLTLTGASSINRIFFKSNTFGTARTVTTTGATVSVSNCDFRDITASGDAGDWDLSAATGGSGNCGGCTGITFTTADDWYWHVDSGDVSNYAKWYTETNGGGSQMASTLVPLPQDTLHFDSSSFDSGSKVITQDMPIIGSVVWTGATNTPTFTTSTDCEVYGSITLISGMTLTASTNPYTFKSRGGTVTLDSGGLTWEKTLTIDVLTGTVELSSNVSLGSTRTLTLTTGTFSCSASNYVISTGKYTQGGGSVSFGSATHLFTATGGTIFQVTGGTISVNTSTLKFTGSLTGATAMNGGSTNFNGASVWNATTPNAYYFQIEGSNTFNNFKIDAGGKQKFLNSSNTTVTTFTALGTSGAHITISNSSSTTHATLTKAGGGVITGCDYIDIQEMTGSPADTWYIGSNSTDAGSTCTNIYLLDPPVSISVFDSVSVSEDFTSFLPKLNVSVFDTVTVAENFASFLPKLNVSVFDTVTVAENVVTFIPILFIDVNDQVSVAENVALFIPELFIDVNDQVTVSENVALSIPVLIDVNDPVSVSEDTVLEVFTYDLNVDVFDSVTVAEDVSTFIPEFFIDVNDQVSVAENIALFIPELFIDVNDQVAVSENVALSPKSYLDVNDSISVAENVDLSIPVLFIDVNDQVTVSENVALSPKSYLDVNDSISVAENVDLSIPVLFIDVNDQVTVSENVALSPKSYLDVYDSVTVSENVSARARARWFNADAITINTGSITSGTIESTWEEDGSYLTLAEVASTPGFSYDFLFYNIGSHDFLNVHFFGRYTGQIVSYADSNFDYSDQTSSYDGEHGIKLQQYNFTSLLWENVTANFDDFPYSATNIIYDFSLSNDADHLVGGELRLRTVHTLPGDTSDQFLIDNLYLNTDPNAAIVQNITVSDVIDLYIPLLFQESFDNVVVSENVVVDIKILTNVFDNVAVSEESTVFIPYFSPGISETITVSEQLSIDEQTYVTPSDSVSVSENVEIEIFTYVNAFDPVTVSENVAVDIKVLTSVYENIVVSEALILCLESFISVFESISVTEDIEVEETAYEDFFESITISENVAINILVKINTNDSVSLVENINAGPVSFLTIFDSILVSENFTSIKNTFGYDIWQHRPQGNIVIYEGFGDVKNISSDYLTGGGL